MTLPPGFGAGLLNVAIGKSGRFRGLSPDDTDGDVSFLLAVRWKL